MRLGFEPYDWNLGFKAGYWVSRLKFEPLGWGLGFDAGFWTLRLEFLCLRLELGPQGRNLAVRGWDLGLKAVNFFSAQLS